MLELFHHPASTCSQKVRLCLAEKGIRDWISRPIDISAGENLTPEFLAINPNGVVPAIRHHGRAVYESTVICEYLDDVFPETPSLSPEDPVDRAHMRAWLRYIDEVPSMAIRVPSFRHVLAARFKTMTDAEFLAFAEANPLRKSFFLKMGKVGFVDADYNAALDQLSRALTRMDKALAATAFLCGPRYTIADACTMPLLVRIEDLGLDDLLTPHAHAQVWYAGLKNRPSFATAFYDGSRLRRQHAATAA